MCICRRKRGTHQILIGALIRGERGDLLKGDRSLIKKEKRHVSMLKVIFSDVKRGTYENEKGALIIKENVQ